MRRPERLGVRGAAGGGPVVTRPEGDDGGSWAAWSNHPVQGVWYSPSHRPSRARAGYPVRRLGRERRLQCRVVQSLRQWPGKARLGRPDHVQAHRAVSDAKRCSDLPAAALKTILQAQHFSNDSLGQPLSASPSSSSPRMTSARMEERVATSGHPAPLLAHSRVIDMPESADATGVVARSRIAGLVSSFRRAVTRRNCDARYPSHS